MSLAHFLLYNLCENAENRYMKKLLTIGLFLCVQIIFAQEPVIDLTLSQAIRIAQENSPEAQAARHTYRAAYWNYRFYKA